MPSRRRHASLLRRAAPALALTGVAGAFLHALDRPSTSGSTTDEVATTADETPSTTSTTTARGGNPAAGSTSPTVPPTCTGDVVEGANVSMKYGTVQVAATVASDGRLCDITVEKAPSGGRSGSITSRSVPTLRLRALTAQNAQFDGVSGATYTSNAYKKSLQAILDAT